MLYLLWRGKMSKQIEVVHETDVCEYERKVVFFMKELNPYKTKSHVFGDIYGTTNYVMILYFEE